MGVKRHMLMVMYMMVNGKMIRNMDMVNGLMQMVLSIMMECGKMMNECMMNEIFQYTTKYKESTNPGWITQTVITNKKYRRGRVKQTNKGVKHFYMYIKIYKTVLTN